MVSPRSEPSNIEIVDNIENAIPDPPFLPGEILLLSRKLRWSHELTRDGLRFFSR